MNCHGKWWGENDIEENALHHAQDMEVKPLGLLGIISALSLDQMVYSFKEGAEVSLPLNQSIHKHMRKHNSSHSKYNHNRKKKKKKP